MNPEELPLRDIHLPDPIGWWPPAPGWWMLVGFVILTALGMFLFIKKRRRFTVKKAAARQLASLRQSDLPAIEKINRLSALIRRIAISTYPRENVASLTGKAWLQFLDEPLNNPSFSKGDGRILVEAPYRPTQSDDLGALFDLCEQWLTALPKGNSRKGEKSSAAGLKIRNISNTTR